jgi:hypothetical protein
VEALPLDQRRTVVEELQARVPGEFDDLPVCLEPGHGPGEQRVRCEACGEWFNPEDGYVDKMFVYCSRCCHW